LADIADTLFQADNIFENCEDGEDDVESQELQQNLRNLFKETDILDMIDRHSAILTQDLSDDVDFQDWLQELLTTTLAGAVKQTSHLLLPDVDERGLVVDTELNDEVLDVWLTESE
ncbi:hypothetical protein AAIH16_40315, partial [Pseudomonas aeruginosa]